MSCTVSCNMQLRWDCHELEVNLWCFGRSWIDGVSRSLRSVVGRQTPLRRILLLPMLRCESKRVRRLLALGGGGVAKCLLCNLCPTCSMSIVDRMWPFWLIGSQSNFRPFQLTKPLFHERTAKPLSPVSTAARTCLFRLATACPA